MSEERFNWKLVGKHVKDHRVLADVTLRSLSKRLGISPATINRIERGKPCDVDTFIRLEPVLPHSFNGYLLEGKPE